MNKGAEQIMFREIIEKTESRIFDIEAVAEMESNYIIKSILLLIFYVLAFTIWPFVILTESRDGFICIMMIFIFTIVCLYFFIASV